MGMFDYIACEVPLPQTPAAPPVTWFQTKDIPDQFMTQYWITAEGVLMHLPEHWEPVPEDERPEAHRGGIHAFLGSMRTVEGTPERVDFHGDIVFYTNTHPDTGRWSYRARFTENRLARIELEEFRPPDGLGGEAGAGRLATATQPAGAARVPDWDGFGREVERMLCTGADIDRACLARAARRYGVAHAETTAPGPDP